MHQYQRCRSRSQSPRALWAAVGCHTRYSAANQFFDFPRVPLGDQPLAKEPKDCGYEIKDMSAGCF